MENGQIMKVKLLKKMGKAYNLSWSYIKKLTSLASLGGPGQTSVKCKEEEVEQTNGRSTYNLLGHR